MYVHKGVSLKAVSQKLGHSNVNITASIYTHTFNSDIEKSASIFDEVVKKCLKLVKMAPFDGTKNKNGFKIYKNNLKDTLKKSL